MAFCNGRELDYNYTSDHDAISRLSSIDDGETTLEAYTYLGLDTVVVRARPETAVDLTYIDAGLGEAGDQYVGLDRLGRIVVQRRPDGSDDFDRLQYTYDADSSLSGTPERVVLTKFSVILTAINLVGRKTKEEP